MRRELVWSSRALQDLAAVARTNRRQADRIEAAMMRYAATEIGDVVKLTNRAEHRLRVGDWPVLFKLEDGGLVVVALRSQPKGRLSVAARDDGARCTRARDCRIARYRSLARQTRPHPGRHPHLPHLRRRGRQTAGGGHGVDPAAGLNRFGMP